jgi:hypothetical protein
MKLMQYIEPEYPDSSITANAFIDSAGLNSLEDQTLRCGVRQSSSIDSVGNLRTSLDLMRLWVCQYCKAQV